MRFARRLGTQEAALVDRDIINSAQDKLPSDMIGMVALSMHERNRKKAKSLCFAEVHNDFKANLDVHSCSVFPVASWGMRLDRTQSGRTGAGYFPGWLLTLFVLLELAYQQRSSRKWLYSAALEGVRKCKSVPIGTLLSCSEGKKS